MKWEHTANGWTAGNYRIIPPRGKQTAFTLRYGDGVLMYCGNFGSAVYEAQKHQRRTVAKENES